MYLFISKRFEFSSSHRLFVRNWSDDKNLEYFGRESAGLWGHGHNFEAFFVFNGPVDTSNGMMINVTSIKDKVKPLIDGKYDHKYLNTDTPLFGDVVPTPENVAKGLLTDVRPLFADMSARPTACHLIESPQSEATAYADGRVERHLWTDFSAARQTYSPHLSQVENKDLFGKASSAFGHGHHYRLRVTLGGAVDGDSGMIFPEAEGRRILDDLRGRFDHRNLNVDVPELSGSPVTTEILARHFLKHLSQKMPVGRVRLFEHDHFFVEFSGRDGCLMGVSTQFHAAHRLHSSELSDDDNLSVYGKCNNRYGHGHLYKVEASIGGELNKRTGTMFRLADLEKAVFETVDEWNYKHLDLEIEEFKNRVTTGENIINVLWPRLNAKLGERLVRLRLWETPNNRFTLRRSVTGGYR
ncbi:MAG: 6-carboxytetrahydropterin synthase [Candidatus Zixiibacteriota bacterium]